MTALATVVCHCPVADCGTEISLPVRLEPPDLAALPTGAETIEVRVSADRARLDAHLATHRLFDSPDRSALGDGGWSTRIHAGETWPGAE